MKKGYKKTFPVAEGNEKTNQTSQHTSNFTHKQQEPEFFPTALSTQLRKTKDPDNNPSLTDHSKKAAFH
jgi:hypothetical protein